MNVRVFLFLVALLPLSLFGQEPGVEDLASEAMEAFEEVREVVKKEMAEETVEEEEIEKSKTDHQLFGKSVEESLEGKVIVLRVGEKDLVNKHSFKFWRRMMERADEEGARAIILELDTPGGLAFDTTEIIVEEMLETKVKIIAYVNPNAISAGAIISAGTDEIYMSDNAVIGSAAVINGTGAEIEAYMRKKIEAVLLAKVNIAADRNGHRFDVLRAMMIPAKEEIRFGDKVVVEEGDLLMLTADQAVQVVDGKPLLAKGIAGSIEEILEKEGMAGAEVLRAEPSGFEKVAWWVGMISPILILVGLGGGYMEMKSPGFGVGGIVSLVAFSLFFFGNYMAGNLAGYEVAAVFVLGIVLLLVEVFFLPGFIIPGVLGLVMIIGAMFFAMVDEFAIEDFKRTDFDWGQLGTFFGGAMWRLAGKRGLSDE